MIGKCKYRNETINDEKSGKVNGKASTSVHESGRRRSNAKGLHQLNYAKKPNKLVDCSYEQRKKKKKKKKKRGKSV
jgi:hypothetical protein